MPKAQVFLAWSGPRSRAVALALREWLPRVIQNLQPWMSENDIDKGTAWHKELSTQLSNITTGIICLTPENLREPWINFEAGALSKLEGSHALTYLFEVEAADVPFPLAGFNATKANKEDTKKLIATLNKKLGDEGLEQAQLDDSFDMWWEKLEADLSKARDSHHAKEPPLRKPEEMLKEIVDTLRFHSGNHAKILTAVELLLAENQILSSKNTARIQDRSLLDGMPKTLFNSLFSQPDPRYHGTFSTGEPSSTHRDDSENR